MIGKSIQEIDLSGNLISIKDIIPHELTEILEEDEQSIIEKPEGIYA